MNHPIDNSSSIIVIGRLGRVHGLQGWLNVISYTQVVDAIQHYLPWQIQWQGQWQDLAIEGIQCREQQILVRFVNYQQREQAQLLTNSAIGITRSQLPALAPEEYYWTDLLGMTVINRDGQHLGIVRDFYETGANDVLIVKGEKEYWIPYLPPTTIKNIDINQRIILVDWDSDF